MKKCPYCEAELSDTALKCKFCWEWVVDRRKNPFTAKDTTTNKTEEDNIDDEDFESKIKNKKSSSNISNKHHNSFSPVLKYTIIGLSIIAIIAAIYCGITIFGGTHSSIKIDNIVVDSWKKTGTVQKKKWEDIIQLENIMKGRHVYWNKSAETSILVFAAPDCIYSARHIATDKTIQNIIEKNPNVNMIYIDFPIKWYEKSEIIQCFSDNTTEDNFYKFVFEVYSDTSIDLEKIYSLVRKYWWSTATIRKCVDNWNWTKKLDFIFDWIDSTSEFFNINWTPSNIIWNHKTDKYEVIAWAYPIETFQETINNLNTSN